MKYEQGNINTVLLMKEPSCDGVNIHTHTSSNAHTCISFQTYRKSKCTLLVKDISSYIKCDESQVASFSGASEVFYVFSRSKDKGFTISSGHHTKFTPLKPARVSSVHQ